MTVILPNFDVKVDIETAKDDAKKIYKLLRPEANLEKVKIEKLKDGFINLMFRCYEEDKINESVIMRSFALKITSLLDNLKKDKTDENINSNISEMQNKELELSGMIEAAKLNLSPVVQAKYTNGIVYNFVQGDTLKPDQALEESIACKTAQVVAQIHCLKVKDENCKYNTQLERMEFEEKIKSKSMEDELNKRITNLPIYLNKELLSFSELQKLGDEIYNYLKPENNSFIGFCHNDLNLKNIIYNQEDKSVKLIDFEWVENNYVFYDIAMHFECIATDFPSTYRKELLPSEDFKKNWLKNYWTEINKIKNLQPSEQEMENLLDKSLKFVNIWMVYTKIQLILRSLFYILSKHSQEELTQNSVFEFPLTIYKCFIETRKNYEILTNLES